MPRKYVPKTDKRLSDETKAKIAASVKARNSTPEARAAIAERSSRAMKAYHERTRQALALLAEQEANGG